MFLHPHCPCSRASVGELAKLMAQCQGQVKAVALVYKATEFKEGWEKTDLWRSAERIPGVQVLRDDGGLEAAKFHARTSGQVILYDKKGRLQFSGGITSGRGHAGDNPGRSALSALLREGKAEARRTAVFGCLIQSPSKIKGTQNICCQK